MSCSLLPVNTNQKDCLALLDGILGLFHQPPLDRPPDSQTRLQSFLSHYCQDDVVGASFRSMVVFGVANRTVTIDDFNLHVIRPRSHFSLQLSSPSEQIASIQLTPVSKAAQVQLHKDTLSLAYRSVLFVLTDLQNSHVQLCYKLPCYPQKWKNAILGIVDDHSSISIVETPTLDELFLRIRQSLEYSANLKISTPLSYFYSEKSVAANGKIFKRQSITNRFTSAPVLRSPYTLLRYLTASTLTSMLVSRRPTPVLKWRQSSKY